MKAVLDLDRIAAVLEGLEETIIAKLIDRVQFRHNPRAYRRGESGFEGEKEQSLFALRLRCQEEMDARFGRFCVPEERPFTADLPAPGRRVTLPDRSLKLADYNRVNLTAGILDGYLELLPAICDAGDDGQYGSSVEHDVYALQAVSRRVHFGAMYVAESKYRSDARAFREAIRGGDTAALTERLTRREVERRIVGRVALKVETLQASSRAGLRIRLDPDAVCRFYESHVIPLTKAGEIRYLLAREPR